MTVESATNINDLNPSFPSGTDRLRDGDDHIRLIKSVLRRAFDSLNGSLSVSAQFLNSLPQQVPQVGMVQMFWGTAEQVPVGWAICDGRVVPRSDGTGNFQTPDMRGRVPIGVGPDFPLGLTSGQVSRTATTESAGDHSHTGQTAPAGNHSHLAGGGTISSSFTGITVNAPIVRLENEQRQANAVTSVSLNDPGHTHTSSQTPTTEAGTHAHDFGTSVNGAHAHAFTVNVMQPSVALFFIVKV